jgi:DHA1 family bicyclomycin/chloramphenicol resistance-like MFS transporter
MSSDSPPQNKKEFIFLIIILGSIIAIGPFTIDMYLPAFTAIADSFGAPEPLVQLSLTSYFIGLALGQIFYGPIIDRFGCRIPLFLGLLIYIASSLACCFSSDIEQLIALRFFQAIGACACVVAVPAVVRDIFPPQECARIFSRLMLVFGIAPVVAPILGNIFLLKFGWESIFVFAAGFGIFCLGLAYYAVPAGRGPNPEDKITNALQKYFGILHDRNFVICALVNALTMSALLSYITGSPFVYLKFFNISSNGYSLFFCINAIGLAAIAQINAQFLKKFSIEEILGKALLIAALTGLALVFTGQNNPTFWSLTSTLFVFLMVIGVILPNSAALALANQAKHSGSAAALLGTIQFTLATIASFLVSEFNDGTAFSMSLLIGSCGVGACLVYRVFR